MYLTYPEYFKMGGTLQLSAFNAAIYEAERKLDYYTLGKLKEDETVSEAVKRALAKITELISIFNTYRDMASNVTDPVTVNQSNDGVSVSYGGYMAHTAPQDIATASDKLERDIQQIVKTYLIGEKNQAGELLIYRGV